MLMSVPLAGVNRPHAGITIQGERPIPGSVAEWSIAPVLKTGNGQPFVSSNLTASAKSPF